eukprot:COSAG02_NODE_16709_length_1062_cov_0.835929_1_plen_282_part_00
MRKPFANNKHKSRLIDQKNAMLYYAGLLNEFSQNDKVIVDTTWLTAVDKADLDNFERPPFTGLIVGNRSSGAGRPRAYDVELRRVGSFSKRSMTLRIMKAIPGDSLTRFTDVMQLAGENPDDEDYGMLSDDIDSEEDAADASTEDATTEAIGMLQQYGDSVRSGDGSTEGPVWPAADAAAELHPGEIARRAALESLAVSAALRLFRRFFPDDDDTLGRRVAASAVAACGGQVGFRRMLEDGDAVAFALIDEHRHAAASSAAESSGPSTSSTAKQDGREGAA